MAAEEMTTLYDRDFFEWTWRVARLLREGRLAEVDVEHLAEEIEDVGKREQRAVWSHLRFVLVHLLKWQTQPERRSRHGKASIRTFRITLSDILAQSPSLKRNAGEVLARAYEHAIEILLDDTGRAREQLSAACPYTLEQILDLDFLPGSD